MSTSSARAVSMMIGTVFFERMPAAHLEPVHARHHHVEDDEVVLPLVEARERLAAVGRADHLVPVLLERIGEKRLDGALVVDEQDAG